MKIKKNLAICLVGGALSAGVLAIGSPASAACTLGAVLPHKNANGFIAGTATRGTTCSNSAYVTATVRQQRTLQPDDVIATNGNTITNSSVTATSGKKSGATVRTRANSSTGAQSESAWVQY